MRTLATIKNQYDNNLRCFEWSKSVAQGFMKSIKEPLIVEKKDMIPQWKFCTALGPKRCTENMGVTDILILDFDDANYSIKEFEDSFRDYFYILHTSHSYDGTNQKFRVFLFLDQEYDIQRLFFKASDKTFSPYHYLINYFEHVDPASFVKAQFFKMPAIKAEGAPYYYHTNNGKLFNIVDILGFEFKMAYDYCIERQEEHLRKLQKAYEKWRKKNGGLNLTKAKEYIEQKIESTSEGGRHNTIFGLACWFKKIGGSYEEFSQIIPSWADRDFHKQLRHIELEWAKLR